MAMMSANGVELWYETLGYPEDAPLLLIMGLGGQAVAWQNEFCQGLVDRGFYVIRFDNRDVGLSTKFPHQVDLLATAAALATGQSVEAPYRLEDMARDALAILDHLEIDQAHVAGVSMGGMIAQTLAVIAEERLSSLISIMSSTGEAHVGQPSPEAMALFMGAVPTGRDGAMAEAVRWGEVIGSPEHFDPERVKAIAAEQFDRCFEPGGVARQLVAIATAPDRSAQLAELTVSTLVIHGTADKLIDVSGGERTAELIPNARLELLEGMGHDLAVYFWAPIIESITRHAAAAAAAD